MITKGWDLPNVGLVGIIDADSLLSIPDFKSDERAFQNIVQLIGRAGRTASHCPGKAVIQTFNPENFVLKTAAEMNFENFYQKEIRERKTLKYPPFSKLVKLLFRNRSRTRTDSETASIYKFLKNLPSKNIQVLPPHYPLVPKIRDTFRKQIIIKILNSTEIPAPLEKFLKKLSADWAIDIDPISII